MSGIGRPGVNAARVCSRGAVGQEGTVGNKIKAQVGYGGGNKRSESRTAQVVAMSGGGAAPRTASTVPQPVYRQQQTRGVKWQRSGASTAGNACVALAGAAANRYAKVWATTVFAVNASPNRLRNQSRGKPGPPAVV